MAKNDKRKNVTGKNTGKVKNGVAWWARHFSAFAGAGIADYCSEI
jgi:hypothetical protein